jgi:hypothetical protein
MKLTLEKLLEILPDFKLDHRGKNLIGPCPACKHDEFGITLEEGHRFGCYRKAKCGFNGNIITLLRYLGKLDEVIQEKFKNLPEKIISIQKFEELEELDIPTVDPPIGWRRVYDLPYLNERGFTEQDYHHYPVGITRLDPRLKTHYVVFLTEQDGVSKGWVARRMQSKGEIEAINSVRKTNNQPLVKRYINSFSDFAKMCYGIDDVNEKTETLIIVEGIFDKKNTDKLMSLRHQDATKCIATYKAAISNEQIALIMQKGPNIKDIILLYDSDVIKSIKHSMSIIERYYNVLVGYHATKDPGDMDIDDLSQVLETLQSPIEFKSFKLEVNKL